MVHVWLQCLGFCFNSPSEAAVSTFTLVPCDGLVAYSQEIPTYVFRLLWLSVLTTPAITAFLLDSQGHARVKSMR